AAAMIIGGDTAHDVGATSLALGTNHVGGNLATAGGSLGGGRLRTSSHDTPGAAEPAHHRTLARAEANEVVTHPPAATAELMDHPTTRCSGSGHQHRRTRCSVEVGLGEEQHQVFLRCALVAPCLHGGATGSHRSLGRLAVTDPDDTTIVEHVLRHREFTKWSAGSEGAGPGTRSAALLLDLLATLGSRQSLASRHAGPTHRITRCLLAQVAGLGDTDESLAALLRHPDQEFLHRLFIATIVLVHTLALCAAIAHLALDPERIQPGRALARRQRIPFGEFHCRRQPRQLFAIAEIR